MNAFQEDLVRYQVRARLADAEVRRLQRHARAGRRARRAQLESERATRALARSL